MITKRERLPDERKSITHRFTIVANTNGEPTNHVFYLQVGLYPDGRPGELFLSMKNDRTPLASMIDQFAIAFSLALQYGCPISSLCQKFQGQRFEPCGLSKNKSIPMTTSVTDYVARWLLTRFGEKVVA